MRRPALAAAAFYMAATVVLVAPLLVRFASTFPHDTADPVLNSWLLAWSVRHLPLTADWWNAGMFYPAPHAMALSETLLGLLPIAAPVLWITGNATAAYNTAFVLSFPLCGVAAYALARELTGRPRLALVAGLAYAFAPYRAAQLAHVQVLSYYWAPLALLGLHVYLRTSRNSALALFAASWLMQALTNGYALFHLSILLALWIVWFVRSPRLLASIAAAWGAAAVPLAPILWRYWDVHRAWHLTRDINEIRRFGLDVADLFRAPLDLLVWGGRLGIPRPETAAFPGVTVLAVGVAAAVVCWRGSPRAAHATWDRRVLVAISAIAALAAFSTLTFGPWRLGPLTVTDFHKPFTIAVFARALAFLRSDALRRAFRARSVWWFYGLAAAAMYVLALGPEPRLLGRPLLYEPPYAWLMRLPGFDTLRVPARFVMLGVLCQSMLLAAAVGALDRLLRERRALGGRAAAALTAAVLAGLLVDGAFRLPAAAPPRPSPRLPADVQAVVELPLGEPDVDFGALYRSLAHRRPVANGYSGYAPAHYLPLAHAIREGRYGALGELTAREPLGVLVDTTRADAARAGEGLAAIGASPHALEDSTWQLFVVPRAAAPPEGAPAGTPVPIADVTASHEPEHVHLLRDEDLTTAWGTGLGQAGGETVTVALARTADISAVVLRMGAFAFGFPRELAVETSLDGRTWQQEWSGVTDVLTVRGALADPASAPLAIRFAATRARYLRLVQRGAEPGIPWWVAELQVF